MTKVGCAPSWTHFDMPLYIFKQTKHLQVCLQNKHLFRQDFTIKAILLTIGRQKNPT